MNRRRIQPKVATELLTVGFRLPVRLVRAVEQYAECLVGSTDRRYGITPAIGIALWQDAEFLKTLSAAPAARAPSPTQECAAVPTRVQKTDLPGGARPSPLASSCNTRNPARGEGASGLAARGSEWSPDHLCTRLKNELSSEAWTRLESAARKRGTSVEDFLEGVLAEAS